MPHHEISYPQSKVHQECSRNQSSSHSYSNIILLCGFLIRKCLWSRVPVTVLLRITVTVLWRVTIGILWRVTIFDLWRVTVTHLWLLMILWRRRVHISGWILWLRRRMYNGVRRRSGPHHRRRITRIMFLNWRSKFVGKIEGTFWFAGRFSNLIANMLE